MISMSVEAILSDLKQKKFKPIYFLQGDEGYFIDQITDYIEENVLEESERDFNQTVLYGRDTKIDEIVSVAKRFPMMSEYQVVIIKEAQHLSREIEKLIDYANNPQTSTILVINYKYKKLDGRKGLSKVLKSNQILFNSDKIKDWKLAEWIADYGKKHGLSIEPKASHLLAEYLGNDLSKIVNVVEKLKIALNGQVIVDTEVVSKNVGVSKEFNVFELQSALAQKNIYKANLIANHFAQNPKNHPLVVTVSSLFNYFVKVMKYHYFAPNVSEKELAATIGVHPFFLKEYNMAARNYSMNKLARIFSYLKDTDLKSKGVDNASASDKDLLKELIFKILH